MNRQDVRVELSETTASSYNHWKLKLTHIPTGYCVAEDGDWNKSKSVMIEELYKELEKLVSEDKKKIQK